MTDETQEPIDDDVEEIDPRRTFEEFWKIYRDNWLSHVKVDPKRLREMECTFYGGAAATLDLMETVSALGPEEGKHLLDCLYAEIEQVMTLRSIEIDEERKAAKEAARAEQDRLAEAEEGRVLLDDLHKQVEQVTTVEVVDMDAGRKAASEDDKP